MRHQLLDLLLMNHEQLAPTTPRVRTGGVLPPLQSNLPNEGSQFGSVTPTFSDLDVPNCELVRRPRHATPRRVRCAGSSRSRVCERHRPRWHCEL